MATSARGDIQLNADQILLDYLVQSAIARYDNVEERATINFGFGLLLDYDWIAIGVVVDQFAYSRGEESLALDSDSSRASAGASASQALPIPLTTTFTSSRSRGRSISSTLAVMRIGRFESAFRPSSSSCPIGRSRF